ncbi:MAG: regulatory signaling modulator protein AmpE [Gammaproteobacteria bacterium]
MILVSILISLGVEKFFATVQDLRQFDWFSDYTRRLRTGLGRFGNGAFGVLVIIALPLIGVGLIYFVLDKLDGGYELLGFIFALAVLIFCLGPRNLDEQVQAYIAAREADDTEAVQRTATGILHEDIPGAAFQLSRAVIESILVQANERVLAVWFWFAVLGPVGALLYRLSSVLKTNTIGERATSDFAQAATRLHAILDWLPARLVGLGYAISGSFVDAIANWRSCASKWEGNWQESSIGVLLASGIGALKLDADYSRGALTELDLPSEVAHIKSTQALVWRTLVAWIVIIALMTLAGWAS